jgi:hypothetical protein
MPASKPAPLVENVPPKNGFNLPPVAASQPTRTTVVFPVEMDVNLELCRIKLGLTKNDLIKRAINEFLVGQGFDPSKAPKNLDVSY